MEVDGAKSSAWRRRQRRLRSWLKHERQTVAMALAEYLHHSAQRPVEARAREVEEQDKNNASRRQKAPAPGMHPGVVKEPEVQGSLVAPLRPGSGAAPGLALPSLTGASGEAVDASSLAVLLQFSLGAQEEEEEGEGGGGGEGEGGAEGEVQGKDAGHQPSRQRRYRHAC